MRLDKRLLLTKKALGLTLDELSARLNLPRATVNRVENNLPYSLDTWRKITTWLEKKGRPSVCTHCKGRGAVLKQQKASE